MKVAIFTDTYVPQVNGVARTLQRWTGYLEKKRIPYRVYAPDMRSKEEYIDHIHRFNSVPFWLYPECRLALPNLIKIKRDLEVFRPDLIHIATPFNIGLAGLHFGKKMGIPLVGSYHTHFDQYLDYYKLSFLSSFVWKYMQWFHQPFKKTLVPSLHTKRELELHGLHNIGLWQRGVDHQLFSPNHNDGSVRNQFKIDAPILLTYVGRLAPEKGLDTLMNVAKTLPHHMNKNIHWLIVGDGPLKNHLQSVAPQNMTFAGYQDGESLARIYASSTLFIFPSATETFGNVVLESLSSGTPVVAANAGGVKEIVSHGKTGLLCTPYNHHSFTQGILDLLSDPEKLASMRKQARQEALDRSWEEIFEQLIRDYKDAIGEVKLASFA
ncbi:glycosyltransferase family 4 protein [Halobacillus trueperi]|uniref:Glycosyltransferase family 1 protein n=1 Tax=Halobacillus trueperi TaxID=156205 RepID=A0A3E0J7U9_9BACI|nr:glycosyltransferase family 1 protein [Halobacillus trueperi]REJ09002.1 glycosyltransferase family 1 protein [Halobacillus trueperi]